MKNLIRFSALVLVTASFIGCTTVVKEPATTTTTTTESNTVRTPMTGATTETHTVHSY